MKTQIYENYEAFLELGLESFEILDDMNYNLQQLILKQEKERALVSAEYERMSKDMMIMIEQIRFADNLIYHIEKACNEETTVKGLKAKIRKELRDTFFERDEVPD